MNFQPLTKSANTSVANKMRINTVPDDPVLFQSIDQPIHMFTPEYQDIYSSSNVVSTKNMSELKNDMR